MKHLSFTSASVLRAGTATALALALGACSLIPTYERPDAPVPAQWDTAGQSAAPGSSTSVAELPWREVFTDARLQGLIQQALENNRDLRVAVLNIENLEALYRVQRAERFPTLNGVVGQTRQKPSSTPPFDGISSLASAGINISAFELDLFGRVRSLTAAAAAQLLATEQARRTVHIALVASVANGYYAVWSERLQLALAEQTLQARQSSFDLLQLKFDNGVLNELELRSGQSLVEGARISRAQARRQLGQSINALNLLVGETVSADRLPPQPTLSTEGEGESQVADIRASLWSGLADLPVGLPSDVLLHRPDIAQAEQLLIAANANIGAARAAFFPRISLTASGGVVSGSLDELVSDSTGAWSIAPQLVLPIFDAGRNSALLGSSKVRREIAAVQYEQALQTAFREVADALVARSTYAEQASAQQAQTEAEAVRMKLATLRYQSGVASQLDLLDAQRSLFASQQAFIGAQLARQQSSVALYRALGGGWVSGTQASPPLGLP